MTDKTFDPTREFTTIATTRREVPGVKVSLTEPVLVAFYVSKWIRNPMGVREVQVDLNLQWVGQLFKSA